MKLILFSLLSCLAISWAATTTSRPLLGQKECTYGPSYWCQNLTSAAGCRATKHCIDTVWKYQHYPEDTTSICDTCKTMVKQARDQLLSNETQEEIKEVFEGSCALLHLKLIVKECDKIADEFIPDLIDTLASEMDPQTVCAVAGLCNNQKVRELLAQSETKCSKCHSTMDLIVTKFAALTDEQFLEFLLKICGHMNSYSDACSNAVVTHFQDIFSYVKQNLNSRDVCLLSGECAANFHSHAVEITPQSDIGYVQLKTAKDDMPCDLCKQLVTHLKEILVANTTESEFKQVLEGICKQAKSPFNKECVEFVDNYYTEIYNDVTKALDPSLACQMIGICPAKDDQVGGVIAPLLPVESIESDTLTSQLTRQTIPRDDIVIRVIKPKSEAQTPLSASDLQLPIDLLVPPHQQVYNTEVCYFCQYFLHFVQEEISDPIVEDKIKKVIDTACSRLPESVNETCVEFVDTYEPALIALLAQKIDPSQVCPLIKVCPSSSDEVKDVDIFSTAETSSSCPLCLYAVTELESLVKGKKTKDEIKKDLEKVCSHLSSNLKAECTDFINTYSDELIEMLIADFKPQEVCVYLKLCKDSTPVSEKWGADEEEKFGGDIETNSIYDDTFNGHPVAILNDEKCVLCEFIMKEIDDELKNKKNQDEIKNLVHGICRVLPSSVKDSCDKFVNQYADAIIILLEETMEPGQICGYLKFCGQSQHPLDFVREEVTRCGVCRTAAQFLHRLVKNPRIVDQGLQHVFEKTCRGMSSDMKKTCFSLLYNTERNHGTEMDIITSENSVASNDSIPCYVCMFVVDGVRSLTKDISVIMVRLSTDLICHCFQSPTLRKSCFELTAQFAHELGKLIMELSHPRKVCTAVHLCSNRIELAFSRSTDFYQLKSETLLDQNTDLLPHIDENNEKRKISGTNYFQGSKFAGIECAVCRNIMSLAEHFITKPVTKAGVRKVLRLVCQILHSSLCNSMVNEYLNQIVDLISRSFAPCQICHIILHCPCYLLDGHSKNIVSGLEHRTSLVSFEPKAFENCPLCQAIAVNVRAHLRPPVTKAKLVHLLNTVCNMMPRQRPKCIQFLHSHFAPMLNALQNPKTRFTVCIAIHVCPAPKPITHKCTLCQLGVTVFKTIVSNNLISSWIHIGLLKGCKILPHLVLGFCQSITDMMWPHILRFLLTLNGIGTCQSVSLCATRPFANEEAIIDHYQLEKNPCLTCHSGVDALKQLITVPANVQKIRQGVYKMCEELKHPISLICHMQVDLNWNNIISYLHRISSNELCHIANLCPALNFTDTQLIN